MPEDFVMEYDEESDTAHLRLKGEEPIKSEMLAPGLIIEYNAKDEVVGLKLLNASRSEEGLRKLLNDAVESILRDLST